MPKSRRDLRETVIQLLQACGEECDLARVMGITTARALNLLLSLLPLDDAELQPRVVTAAAKAIAAIADQDLETGRVAMRRLIWNLTEESGNCPWGTPELIGEALAQHHGLAQEFAPILVSYIIPDGNFLDHPTLLRGAVWGIGRLVEKHPDLLGDALVHLRSLAQHPDPGVQSEAHGVVVTLEARTLLKPQTPTTQNWKPTTHS